MSTIVSGFGDVNVNGIYEQIGTHDGYPFYRKTTNDYIIIYKLENGPYSFAPAYWIEKINDIFQNVGGPVKRHVPKYKGDTTNILTATWTPVTEITSGELTIGSVTDESSSSSSSSSIDSSSSSSLDSSSSSSSSEDYSESSSSSEDYSSDSSSSSS